MRGKNFRCREVGHLAMAVNNIHMVLDCDIVLGGYVGSCMDPHLQDLWVKAAERNTFGEKGPYVRVCNYQVGHQASTPRHFGVTYAVFRS